MKWLSLIAILPTAVAFQTAKPAIHRTTSLNFFPEKFTRAEECATHYGSCPLGELDELVDGEFNLRASHTLLSLMENYHSHSFRFPNDGLNNTWNMQS